MSLRVRRFAAPLARSCPFAFSPDGSYLVAGGLWGVSCVEADTGRVVFTRDDLNDVYAVAWGSPDRVLVFARGAECDLRVFALAVPDGGTDSEAILANVSPGGLRVSLSADASVALVAPSIWRKGSLHVGYVLRVDSLDVLNKVLPAQAIGRAAREAPHAMAVLSPDGASVALAFGGGGSATWERTESDDRGMVVTWRWAHGETHTLMAGGVGSVLDLQWLGVDTLMVLRSGTQVQTLPAGSGAIYEVAPRLLVLARGGTRPVTDSEKWPAVNSPGFQAGEQGLGVLSTVHLHEDREKLLVVGFKRGLTERPQGVLRVISARTGETDEISVMACDPFKGFSAQWLGGGEGMAALTADPSGTLSLHLRTSGAPGARALGPVATMSSEGVGARLWRCGERLAVTWVESDARPLSGQLVWLDRSELI